MSSSLETHERALRALAGSRGVGFGLPALDLAIRGCRFGDLSIIAGPPHGGKTQMAMTMALNNPTTRILWFTPDESHPFLIQKMACMAFGKDQQAIENMNRDKKGKAALSHFVEGLGNLKVCEDGGYDTVLKAIDESSRDWGAAPQVVVFDYADLFEPPMATGETTLKNKMTWFKRTAKTMGVAMVVIHQAVKSSIRATAATDPSMADLDYAGHKEATLILWTRMTPVKGPAEKLKQKMHPTMEVWVLKNKWSPARPIDPIILNLEQGGKLIAQGGVRA